MKHILIFLCLVGAAFASCTKTKEPTPSPAPVSTMTASLGGFSFSASGADVLLATNSDMVTIAGTMEYGSIKTEIDLIISGYTGAGTYAINGGNWPTDNEGSYTQYTTGGTHTSHAIHGQITITSLPPDIAGTFYFTCEDSTDIANGKFSLK